MAKRTNHTNRNQNRKDHKHGIKKPRKHALVDTPGVCIARRRDAYISRRNLQEKQNQLTREKLMSKQSK